MEIRICYQEIKMYQKVDLMLLVEVKIELLEINQVLLVAEILWKEIKIQHMVMIILLKDIKMLFKEVEII